MCINNPGLFILSLSLSLSPIVFRLVNTTSKERHRNINITQKRKERKSKLAYNNMDMEIEKLNGGGITSGSTTAAAGVGGGGKDEDDDVPLPGFRFHPTDEELVGFYLRRKVEKRSISIELIKQIDIYKHDPWDLPKASNVGEKEWYFFCKRGRKYRNSIRPNRVTGSGFWKATGIDRPIYSAGGEGRDCIGLKKSLVYYRGSAGKGTKTDWMMHEFRLPAHDHHHHHHHPHHHDIKTTATTNHNITTQEAEVWTLCRIFKRNVSYRKCMPDWKELGAVKKNPVMNNIMDANSKTCSSLESSDNHNNYKQSYISFSSPIITRQAHDQSNAHGHGHGQEDIITNQQQQMFMGQIMSSVSQHQLAPAASYSASSFASSDVTEFLKHGDWDELRSVVEFGAAGRFLL